MADDFANCGPADRATLYHGQPDVIGVQGGPTENIPIGMAFHAGRTEDGFALWRLVLQRRGCRVDGC